MEGGTVSSRGRKQVPKSAVHSKSIPPAERKKRKAASATTQRVPIQPPVVGVQPGRVLGLRTSLGIMKAKALLEEQEVEQQKRTEEFGIDMGIQKSKGRLKQGRLHPLGVVNDPLLLPSDCLGVIPVSPRHLSDSRKQRPRSSTAPGVHFDLPGSHDDHMYERVGKKIKVKRRSHSAILSHNLRPNQHLIQQLLSISKHTALVPKQDDVMPVADMRSRLVDDSSTQEGGDVIPSSVEEGKRELQDSSDKVRILPPVVRHGELGMMIEVKGLRKTSDSSSSPQSSTSTQQHPRGSPGRETQGESLKFSPKLPQISPTTSPERLKQDSNKSSSPLQRTSAPNTSPQRHADESTLNSLKVSVVSVGEAKMDSHNKTRRRRHSSGKQASGRLSLGWSPPQPIEPLKGSPLNTPNRKITAVQDDMVGRDVPNGIGSHEHRASSHSMQITVDVNEFLTDLDLEENNPE